MRTSITLVYYARNGRRYTKTNPSRAFIRDVVKNRKSSGYISLVRVEGAYVYCTLLDFNYGKFTEENCYNHYEYGKSAESTYGAIHRVYRPDTLSVLRSC